MQKKSMCMCFSIDKMKHCGLPVIYLDNCVCQFVKEVKYLGVMIHSTMDTTIDIAGHGNFKCKQIYCYASSGIAQMMSSAHFFQSYCTNMYCCQLWFNSTKNRLIKLSISYNDSRINPPPP